MDFELSDEQQRFVRQAITSGRFSTPDEVIRAGLELLVEREGRLAALRSSIAENERPSVVPPAPGTQRA